MARTKDSQNLMEQAYWQIKEMIFRQKIWPGQKIIYGDLAFKLKMSKTPIMYALGRLEQENFLRLHPNQGYFVKEIDPQEIEDYFQVREALEQYAVRLAIQNTKGKEFGSLAGLIQEHRDYRIPIYDRKKMILDAKVHLQIAKMGGNQILVKQLTQVFEHLYLRFRVEFLHPQRLQVSHEEHQRLLEAMKKGDFGKAERLMRNHVKAARENMISSLAKEEEVIGFHDSRTIKMSGP
jgi:DNA-binding GntR family transcriptional regulator